MRIQFIEFSFTIGFAVRCFECNSYKDEKCDEDIPPEKFQKNCDDHRDGYNYTFCRKIKQVIEFAVNSRKLCKIFIVKKDF